MRLAFAAVMAAALALPLQAAAAPRFDGSVVSDVKGGKAKSTFSPTTPMVFFNARLVDVKSGSVLRSDWVAEKTKVAPPNYKIDSTQVTVGPLTNNVDFTMSKPNAGWPAGDYRIDLFIDGKPAGSVKFRVAS